MTKITIPANEEFSEQFSLPNRISSSNGICYILTESNITDNTLLELHAKSSISSNYYPFYNILEEKNASVPLIKNVFIPFEPYIDGRGGISYKFKVTQKQTNSVIIELGTSTIF